MRRSTERKQGSESDYAPPIKRDYAPSSIIPTLPQRADRSVSRDINLLYRR